MLSTLYCPNQKGMRACYGMFNTRNSSLFELICIGISALRTQNLETLADNLKAQMVRLLD